jgi:thioredoxin 1
MSFNEHYAETEPALGNIEASKGATVLEFGTPWCGFCRAAQPLIATALTGHATNHIKVEDGSGRRLGRAFKVKLWPTLIFIKDGREVERLVRPVDVQSIRQALAAIETVGASS